MQQAVAYAAVKEVPAGTSRTFETEHDFGTLDWAASVLPRIAYAC